MLWLLAVIGHHGLKKFVKDLKLFNMTNCVVIILAVIGHHGLGEIKKIVVCKNKFSAPFYQSSMMAIAV